MIRKITVPAFLALLALMLFACSPTIETAPEAASQIEPETAVAEEEAEMAEEMADEDHSDADMAEMEEMEEIAKEEEMAEEMTDEAMAESMESLYAVNTTDSTVTWTGAKAVGSSHTGGISIAEGSLNVVDGQLKSGTFVLDMNSLTSADGGGNRLLGHLKSDDFFGVETHPTATLVINSAKLIEGDQYTVQADLTIKNITNPIEFVAAATETDGQVTASADIVFDRAQFDVQYGSGSFFSGLGDDLINDEIEISVALVAAK